MFSNRNMKFPLFLILSFSFLFVFPLAGSPYSSINIPVSDRVYDQLDKLIGHGLIKNVIMGQRPWSRMEMGRMVKEARDNLKQICKEEDRDINCLEKGNLGFAILKNLEGEFAEEIGFLDNKKYSKPVSFHPLSNLQVSYTFLDSPSRIIPFDNNVGKIQAVLNPLVQNKEGRHYVDGSNFALESQHWFRLTKFFSFNAIPRFEGLFPDQGANDANIIAQNFYGKFTFHKLELEFGRDSLVWGQGKHGGIILSDNARPLDMLKLSNDRLVHIPVLGNFKGTLYVANLGPEQEFKKSFFSGLKLSFEPAKWLELGFSRALIIGGQDAPQPSAGDVFKEFFFSRGGFLSSSGIQDQNFSNSIYGWEFRFRIPPWHNTAFYFEMFSDDSFFSRYRTNWAYYTGFYVPRIDFNGKFDFRFEFKNFPALFYRHGTFLSGWTLNQQILGDPLGPDSRSFMAEIFYTVNIKHRLGLKFEHASRDSDIWIVPGPSKEFVISNDNPSEKRMSFVITGDHQV